MLKIKLFAVLAFLAFVSVAFLFSSGKTQAQSSEKRDEILKEVAVYKSWKQVQKPEKKVDDVTLITDAVTVYNSTIAG